MCALVSAVRGLKAKFLNLKYKREKIVSTQQQKYMSMYTFLINENHVNSLKIEIFFV